MALILHQKYPAENPTVPVVPPGLNLKSVNPPLKRWAIVLRPLRGVVQFSPSRQPPSTSQPRFVAPPSRRQRKDFRVRENAGSVMRTVHFQGEAVGLPPGRRRYE